MLQFAALWLCVFSWTLSAMAGAAEQGGSPFIVDSWSSEEGLPDNEVISVLQTRDGYLWLGTLHGLVRFDGIHFTIFDENNTPGLPGIGIVFLFEDNETNLWVGTESAGLAVVKNGIVKNFGAESAACGKVIYADEISPGNIIFYAATGLLNYHDGKMTSYPGEFSPQLYGYAAKMLVPSKSGDVWQIANGAVQKWRNGQLEKDFGASPWVNTNVTSACEDDNGNLIVGTLGAGVFWSDADGNFQHISTEQKLSSPIVLSICLDQEGNLWAGTDGGGLNRIKRKIFSGPEVPARSSAQSVAEDESGGSMDGLRGRCVLHEIKRDDGFWPRPGIVGPKRVDGAGGSQTTSLGRHAVRRIVSISN